MLTKKPIKTPLTFICECCNFNTSNKKDFNRHLSTAKHKNLTNLTEKTHKNPKASPHECSQCYKQYKSRMGLWQHSKKCINKIQNDDSLDNNEEVDVVVDLIKQNAELKELILEQSKQLQCMMDNTSTQSIHNQTINNNQKFNLNFFLNTTCKDAMNMSEFIENIQVDFTDIENIGRDGYVSGMTNMILSRIKDLDITKRPLHCTDLKRETMYIKDNDEWSKDNSENENLREMISIVAKHNYNTVPLWRKQHPDCNVSDHPSYNLCMDMMRNIIGDVGVAQSRLDSKVIKNISRHIIVK